MAHGTSGVGWLFAIIYQASGLERFLKGAKEAAEYIEGLAVGDDNAVLIPYLDSLKRPFYRVLLFKLVPWPGRNSTSFQGFI